jgi:hypothetical protein
MSHFNQTFITLIIDRYSLELGDCPIDSIVVTWLQKYDRDWIVKAIVESIHRGRYKVKSVDSILIGWHRLGKPAYKFTAEFEREILQNLPVIPPPNEDPASQIAPSPEPELPADPPILLNLNSDDLNPEESAPFQHHNHSISKILAHHIQAEAIVGKRVNNGSVTFCSTSLTSLQHRSCFDLAGGDPSVDLTEVTTNQLVAQPAKFQLFRTLKAIVEPKNNQIAGTSTMDAAPSSTEDHLPRIANFEFSLGNASGE